LTASYDSVILKILKERGVLIMTKTITITTFTGKTFQFEAHNIHREIIDGVDIYFIDGNSYPAEIVEIQE